MTRKELLDAAAGCVLQDRASQYGGVEDNFGRIAELWTKYLGVQLAPHDVAAMMVLLKIARLRANPHHDDSWVDLAGYAACGAECAGAAKAREEAVHEAGEEYRRLREQEPEFKPGDAVEALSFDGNRWEDAVVRRTEVLSGRRYYTVVLASGEGHCLPAESVRRPAKAVEDGVRVESHWPEFVKEQKAKQTPRFNPGDMVEACTPARGWFEAKYVQNAGPRYHAVEDGDGVSVIVMDGSVRPKPRAEGCEALVEKDAPQTPAELCRRIIDANPATYGHPHKPTGEELAEMAQEDAHG